VVAGIIVRNMWATSPYRRQDRSCNEPSKWSSSLLPCPFIIIYLETVEGLKVPKGRSVMAKGLRSAQQVSSSSQGVHLL